jgi:heme O synthase-like polyprenyltransferase
MVFAYSNKHAKAQAWYLHIAISMPKPRHGICLCNSYTVNYQRTNNFSLPWKYQFVKEKFPEIHTRFYSMGITGITIIPINQVITSWHNTCYLLLYESTKKVLDKLTKFGIIKVNLKHGGKADTKIYCIPYSAG